MPDRPTSSEQIRQDFLDFFAERGHEIVPSAPLVPHDDPTLLFINAGMNPFKDVFLGEGTRPYTRVADTQKCLRVSGKHNDLEEVGVDTYHHTFFEMLGNWSFGDYFKREAIRWAWALLVDRWGLDPDRLYATVHEGDESLGLSADTEAADLWKSETGIAPEHILFQGSKDNFWMMGDTGPCGPCSEIHVDLRPDDERAKVDGASLVNRDDPRVMEIWNLVFIQYNALVKGEGERVKGEGTTVLQPLAAKHVDTGMGFERICAVLQGKTSNYDTDLFAPLFAALTDLGAPTYEQADEKQQIAMRVVADHVRTLAFAIADGASPSNTGRGYVIRRILRRAVRFGYQALGFREPFLYKLVEPLKEKMGGPFPELAERQATIERTIRAEEEAFLRTLGTGIEMFQAVVPHVKRLFHAETGDEFEEVRQDFSMFHDDPATFDILDNAFDNLENEAGQDREAKIINRFSQDARKGIVSGEIAFLLHDTYGFPGDLTALMAREEGLTVDEARFSELMEEQRKRARAAGQFGADYSNVEMWHVVSDEKGSSFVGYDTLTAEGLNIIKSRDAGEHFEVVLDRTPFYAESGGQVGDTGYLVIDGEQIQVIDTQKDAIGDIVHTLESRPKAASSNKQPWELFAEVEAVVTSDRRRETRKHHTATHLLHAALRETLGEHVQQKGSLVAPDRLRFDFSHFERVTPEEQRRVERRVNALIQQNLEACIEPDVPIAEAKQRGAMALFGEKYGETVRVVTFGESVELCGGTHVGATGEIGLFRIVSEGSVASGVRRIEAVAGEAALDWLDQQIGSLDAVRSHFKSLQKPVEEAVADVLDEVKTLEKEVASLKQEQAASGLGRLIDEAEDVDGVRLVTGDLGIADMDTLRETATQFRDTLGPNAVAVLGAADPEGGKVYLSASVSDDLVKRGVQAGRLVGVLAKKVGGGGGGRPTLATAGGRQPENLPDALGAAADALREML